MYAFVNSCMALLIRYFLNIRNVYLHFTNTLYYGNSGDNSQLENVKSSCSPLSFCKDLNDLPGERIWGGVQGQADSCQDNVSFSGHTALYHIPGVDTRDP